MIATLALFALSACKEEPKGTAVSMETSSFDWPLTISAGEVQCLEGSHAVFVSGGQKYALNGMASSWAEKSGYIEIDLIWKPHPTNSALKVNIGPLIDLALKNC